MNPCIWQLEARGVLKARGDLKVVQTLFHRM